MGLRDKCALTRRFPKGSLLPKAFLWKGQADGWELGALSIAGGGFRFLLFSL
jgi:hypothetical protein